MYAWVIMAGGIGEIVTIPFAGQLADKQPYSLLLLLSSFMFMIGGGVYALATNVWMAILGRFFTGCGGGGYAVALHSYIGEMGTRMDRVRKDNLKRPLKFVLYSALSFIMNGGFVVAFGM